MNRFITQCLVLFALGLLHTQAQNLYYNTEIKLEGGPSILAKMGKSTVTVYQKANKMKLVTKTTAGVQEILSDENLVTISNEQQPKCAKITKAELLKDSLENPMATTDLKVEKTTETEKLLGHACIKTKISYKVSGYDYQSIYWTTKEITAPVCSEYTKRNSLLVAIQKLDGFVMKCETTMYSSGIKTISTVTEVNMNDIADSVFEIKAPCKNPLNLADYKAELEKQNRDAKNADRFNSGMQMRSH